MEREYGCQTNVSYVTRIKPLNIIIVVSNV